MSGVPELALGRVEGLQRYRPGKPSRLAQGKLSANESVYGPAPVLQERMGAGLAQLHRYDGGQSARAALAEALGLPAERIVLTGGSDELCYLVAQVFLHEPGHRVVLSDPSYAIDVTVSRLAAAELDFVPLVHGGHDLDGLLRASRGARLLWLPTPHNPTGCAVPPDALLEFARAVPADCVLVIDEAYRGYVEPEQEPDAAALMALPNVILQRTFSKDYGLAGLRVGYGIADPGVIAAFDTVRGPFNVNAVALRALEAIDEAEPWRRMGVMMVRQERDALQRALDRLGIAYHPSQANFVSVRIPYDQLEPRLAARGIMVRAGEDLGMPGWSRITVGWPPQMALLREAIEAWVASGDAAEER